MKTLTVLEINKRDTPVTLLEEAATAIASTEDFYVATTDVYGAKYSAKIDSGRIVVLLKNDTASAITVHLAKGDTQFSLAESVIVPASGTVAVNVDNGKHKFLQGDYMGEVVITGPSAFKASVVNSTF